MSMVDCEKCIHIEVCVERFENNECIHSEDAFPKPCWWCKDMQNIPLRRFTQFGCESITVKFCPNCGRSLE